jgi:hypothetical protein
MAALVAAIRAVGAFLIAYLRARFEPLPEFVGFASGSVHVCIRWLVKLLR